MSDTTCSDCGKKVGPDQIHTCSPQLKKVDTMRDAFEAWYATNAFDYAKNPIGSRDCGLQWAAWQAAQSQPAPPVPSSVQEIMRLMNPYVRACVELDAAPVKAFADTQRARCEAAFKPLEAALTALVDERDRLKFELDGVRAMRGPLSDEHRKDLLAAAFYIAAKDDEHAILKSDDAERIVDLLSELSGFAPPTHGIEPEQGESHAK